MAPKQLDRRTVSDFLSALDALTPETAPQWGTLNASRMVANLTQSFRISLNEVPVVDQSNWFLRRFGVVLFFELMPVPRNIKAPAVFDPPSVGELDAEKEDFRDIMERFLAAAEATPDRTGTSPLLGPQPLRAWQRVHAVHLNHHFRQFGLIA